MSKYIKNIGGGEGIGSGGYTFADQAILVVDDRTAEKAFLKHPGKFIEVSAEAYVASLAPAIEGDSLPYEEWLKPALLEEANDSRGLGLSGELRKEEVIQALRDSDSGGGDGADAE